MKGINGMKFYQRYNYN